MKKTRTRVREMAVKRGIKTAYQLQKAANLHPSMAARLYKDNAKGASWSTLDLVCDALDCDISDILVREEVSQPVK